jgi:hypothetical protein
MAYPLAPHIERGSHSVYPLVIANRHTIPISDPKNTNPVFARGLSPISDEKNLENISPSFRFLLSRRMMNPKPSKRIKNKTTIDS